MSIELLRQKIKELNKERDHATLEKGLAADENKDLRENSSYDYWHEKEMTITAKIYGLIREIERLSAPKAKSAAKKKSSNERRPEKIKDLPKNRWL